MRTKKYYQYKYLLEKINHQFTNNQLMKKQLNIGIIGTGMSLNKRLC